MTSKADEKDIEARVSAAEKRIEDLSYGAARRLSIAEEKLGTLEERFDEVFPALARRPLTDESAPPDVPCRNCAADVSEAESPLLRGKRWYCSEACADNQDPLEAA